MKEVSLDLSIEEANLILEALGEMPYRRVYTLVAKIQQQASSQLQESAVRHGGDTAVSAAPAAEAD